MVKRNAAAKSRTNRVRVFPPIPKGFDAEKSPDKELRRYGLPPRPDPVREPGLAALWDRYVRRFRDFEHLQAALTPADPPISLPSAPLPCSRVKRAATS
jgi:hypothetical protein